MGGKKNIEDNTRQQKWNKKSHTLQSKISKVCLPRNHALTRFLASTSVIRLGDLLDFGELFKAIGNN